MCARLCRACFASKMRTRQLNLFLLGFALLCISGGYADSTGGAKAPAWNNRGHVDKSTIFTSKCSDGEDFPDKVGVMYWNRHHGTREDMIHVVRALKIDLVHFNPHRIRFCNPHGITKELTQGCWNDAGASLCYTFDVIVVGDSTVDARTWLSKACYKPIIIQLTNRFDWRIRPGDDDFYQLFSNATRMPNVFWVANNPLERWYMERKLNTTLPDERYALIRPTGFSYLEGLTVAEEEKAKIAVVAREFIKTLIIPVFEKAKVPLAVYPKGEYGGPKTLTQHVAIVEFPYQVSTMAMYENLAAGVAYIVPTPKLLQEGHKTMGQLHSSFDQYLFPFANWENHTEWYHADFRDLFIYFDTWEELIRIAQDPRLPDIAAKIKKQAVDRMQNMRMKDLNDWRKVFHSSFCLVGKCGSALRKAGFDVTD